jgi:hypothetical protein
LPAPPPGTASTDTSKAEPVTDSRSRLTISVDFSGHGIGTVLVPLIVRREARKEMPDNVSALKRMIERR